MIEKTLHTGNIAAAFAVVATATDLTFFGGLGTTISAALSGHALWGSLDRGGKDAAKAIAKAMQTALGNVHLSDNDRILLPQMIMAFPPSNEDLLAGNMDAAAIANILADRLGKNATDPAHRSADLRDKFVQVVTASLTPVLQDTIAQDQQQGSKKMKIFISHSSKNVDYGSALVNLLTGVGVDHESIIFTSETSYGIPVGNNIFNWLKAQISDRPFVIYLLSPEYYSSVACLNEMGAAWVVENQHAAIFTPDFDLNDANFRNGALDPREIGFYINDEDRVTEFIESLRANFKITPKQVVINSKRRDFLKHVGSLSKVSDSNKTLDEKHDRAKENQEGRKPVSEPFDTPTTAESKNSLTGLTPPTVDETKNGLPQRAASKKQTPTERYFQDLADDKLKDEEVMVIYYASDTAQYNLGTGWRTTKERERIQGWEELNKLGDTLSTQYEQALKRLDLRTLTEVSEVTSHGNPRQVTLVEEMKSRLLELPENFDDKCREITRRALVLRV